MMFTEGAGSVVVEAHYADVSIAKTASQRTCVSDVIILSRWSSEEFLVLRCRSSNAMRVPRRSVSV